MALLSRPDRISELGSIRQPHQQAGRAHPLGRVAHYPARSRLV